MAGKPSWTAPPRPLNSSSARAALRSVVSNGLPSAAPVTCKVRPFPWVFPRRGPGAPQAYPPCGTVPRQLGRCLRSLCVLRPGRRQANSSSKEPGHLARDDPSSIEALPLEPYPGHPKPGRQPRASRTAMPARIRDPDQLTQTLQGEIRGLRFRPSGSHSRLESPADGAPPAGPVPTAHREASRWFWTDHGDALCRIRRYGRGAVV
jgi:hypothetical protein